MIFQRFAIWLLGWLGRLLFRVQYIGTDNIPKQGAVIVIGNHTNGWDPLLHAFNLKRDFHIMAKKELFRFKPFGWLLRQVGAFPVERGKGDRGAVETAEKVLRDGGMLLMFPEGTRSRTGHLLPFKTGAALFSITTGAPIVPSVIRAPKGIGLFRPTEIEYGEPITAAELVPEYNGEITGVLLKAASGRLRARIAAMLGGEAVANA